MSDDGVGIAHDCTLCHSILAYDSEQPFEYVQPPDTTGEDYQMHRYLHQEFIGGTTDSSATPGL
ncbi:MAG: hypothetical protein GY835_23470 [bacterium]|nr:hypothetical protein [bacterium]